MKEMTNVNGYNVQAIPASELFLIGEKVYGPGDSDLFYVWPRRCSGAAAPFYFSHSAADAAPVKALYPCTVAGLVESCHPKAAMI